MKSLIPVFFIVCFFSCNTPADEAGNTTYTSTAANIDLKRDNPKSGAIAAHEEKVANDLNAWYFRVKLFETAKRFTYRLTLQYEEVTGEDEITFPNLGMDPQPVIQKGTKPYECLIGFKDQEGTFKEYKKVHVVEGNLKVTTLKSYAVKVKE